MMSNEYMRYGDGEDGEDGETRSANGVRYNFMRDE